MLRLVFDLDGTLLDVRRRHYEVYGDCLRDFGATALTADAYWTRRRRGEGAIQIAAERPGVDRERFQHLWIERIESPERLRGDTLFPGVLRLLEDLGAHHELVIATLRRDGAALLEQLNELGVAEYFTHVLTPAGDGDPASKLSMVSALGWNGGTWVIGDSEADVALAQRLPAELVCVRNGVRDAAFLRAAGAGRLVAEVGALPSVLPTC